MFYVPVVNLKNEPLMPTTLLRARRWIASGKGTPFWKKGLFCVRLNTEPSDNKLQPIAVGVDPGSKKEGFTVKSESHTFLNVQADAVTWVKDAVETRRNMRRARRFRKTPCRANHQNRKRGEIPPSTKARWQWKLRVLNWIGKMFQVQSVVVEDIKAKTKGQRRWDMSFSPLEVGKQYFYTEVRKSWRLETRQGWETKELRDSAGLKKSSAKMSNRFDAHCVDSWVLANWYVGGHTKPENESMLLVAPLRFHRRQLHALQPAKGNVRRPYGSTCSHGFIRGSLVEHPKFGLTYIGGCSQQRISLHAIGQLSYLYNKQYGEAFPNGVLHGPGGAVNLPQQGTMDWDRKVGALWPWAVRKRKTMDASGG